MYHLPKKDGRLSKKGKNNIPTIVFLQKSKNVDYQDIIDSLNKRTESTNKNNVSEKQRNEKEVLQKNKYVLFIKNNKINLIKNNGEGVYKTFEQSLKPRPIGNIQLISDFVNNNLTGQEELDDQYFAAIEAGDMETVQKLVNEQAERKGYNLSSDYQGCITFRKKMVVFQKIIFYIFLEPNKMKT